jgi:hypothetical protein
MRIFLKFRLGGWCAFHAALFCLLGSIAPRNAAAQDAGNAEPYTWRNVKILAGGFIPDIVFSLKQPGLAYCRTDMGGAYRWDRSRRS